MLFSLPRDFFLSQLFFKERYREKINSKRLLLSLSVGKAADTIPDRKATYGSCLECMVPFYNTSASLPIWVIRVKYVRSDRSVLFFFFFCCELRTLGTLNGTICAPWFLRSHVILALKSSSSCVFLCNYFIRFEQIAASKAIQRSEMWNDPIFLCGCIK